MSSPECECSYLDGVFVECLGDCLGLTLFYTCLFCIYYNLPSFTNLQLNLGLDLWNTIYYSRALYYLQLSTLTRHVNIEGSGDSCT